MMRSPACPYRLRGFPRRAPAPYLLAVLLLFAAAPALAGCGSRADAKAEAVDASPVTAESLEGLILEGEGPIPARLIYRSRNTISSEEDRLVLEEIAMELDRLVELAGNLDAAMRDESSATGQMPPGGEERPLQEGYEE